MLLVAVNVGAALWNARIDHERTALRAQRELSNLAALLSEQTAATMESVDLVLRDSAREGNAARVAAMAPRLRDEMPHIPQVAAVLVIDARGRVVGRTHETPAIDRRFGERMFFTAHRDGRARGLFLDDPYLGAADGTKWRFVMSRRLDAPDGAFGGVIAALMEIENFDRLYRAIDLGKGAFINLRTRDGMVITRVPDGDKVRGRNFPNPQISAAVEREGRFTGWTTSPILNQRVLLSSVAVRGFPLEVLAGLTEDAVFAPWRDEAWRIAGRTVLTSAAMALLIALAAWGLRRRERALQEREQRLRQGAKMEAVGRLAGGIAHDFNNILGGILGYAEMLVEGAKQGSPEQRYAGNVLTAAKRASSLVEQILSYSRSQRGKRIPVQLERVVAETLELVRGSLRGGVELEARLPVAPLCVIGDPTQLHQITMNLCTNALHAMGEHGRLRVTLGSEDVAAERAFAHTTLASGRYAKLEVEDSGSGMDPATLARLFEPFFTTKEVGKGTGLGLSLVYGIVTDSAGAIDVASSPSRGSRFTIYLPRVDSPAAVDESEPLVAPGRGERVLVVDDEDAIVAVTCESLKRLGYRPSASTDGSAALADFESGPQRFDAVITDEVMPGLTGTEFAAALRRRRPDLPILLVSGYVGPLMRERAASAGVREILKKPVESRALAAALARAFGRA
ncbi:MAG: hypothetical protein QOD26_2105 [Betaproteobacteria bacterium]|nr:hypothetical protein [Betaproteobacteria bacterium]